MKYGCVYFLLSVKIAEAIEVCTLNLIISYVLPSQMSVAVSRVDYKLLQTEHCTELKN